MARTGGLRGFPLRSLTYGALLAAAFVALFLLAGLLGPVAIAPLTVFHILGYEVTGGAFGGSPCGSSVDPARCATLVLIVWESIVPEILLAFLAGALLGVSGGLLQGVFRNPLADPYLLGISTGAAIGASILFVFGVGLAQANLTLPLLAFVGALLTGLVILLAARSARSSIETLLLTGVALNAFLSGGLVFTLLYNPIGNLQLNFWLLGGVFGATWSQVGLLFGGLLVVGALVVLHGRALNLLQLGGDVAQSLGLDSRRVVMRSILLASVATALAVAFTGVIGFVGLIAPHIARRLFGYDYRRVLPISALVGAILLGGAFDLSFAILPSTELPIGVPMAFLGGPFFVYVLYRYRQGSGPGAGA
ncbi:MAG: FecCD family ABC transporter permease [Thermoplasmata archaeon]|jgi:iron complex transport system permease protein